MTNSFISFQTNPRPEPGQRGTERKKTAAWTRMTTSPTTSLKGERTSLKPHLAKDRQVTINNNIYEFNYSINQYKYLL
jgi:hypothetical protein